MPCSVHRARGLAGFSLIELLVVVAVLGLLAALLTPFLWKGIALAQEAARRRILFEQSRDGIVILDRAGKSVVFVAQDGRAVAREVQTGLQNDGWTEILSGLEAGATVVVEGQTQLRDGLPVEVL